MILMPYSVIIQRFNDGQLTVEEANELISVFRKRRYQCETDEIALDCLFHGDVTPWQQAVQMIKNECPYVQE